MNNLPFQSATELTRAIREKQIGSAELLEIYIERYERLNPRLNAIVDTDFENARTRAHKADEALAKGENWGPLHGLPMTIKDCIEVIGMHSTWGSPLFKDYVSTRNADVVQPLLDAGAVVFGKTNIPLWAMDTQSFNEVYGQTNNPWEVTRSPGGSSGGAAAALAAGLTGLEIGSDIGGSIRSPAHFCGVYGHKPTYGIVPMYGQSPPLEQFTIDYAVGIDIAVTGPLARSAEDLDLVMDLVVRPARPQRKAVKIDLPAPRKKSLKEYRIGLWLDDVLFPPDTETGNCLQKMADNLAKAGAKIEEKKPDIDFAHCLEVYFDLLTLATVFTTPQNEFDQLLQASKTLDKNNQSPETYMARTTTKLHREWQLLNVERSFMRQKWDDYFREIDVLLCPAVRVPAVPHDHTDIAKRLHRFNDQDLSHAEVLMPWAGLTIVSYLPATVAPVGLTKSGLPVGVQIVGPYMEDRTPIHVAKLMKDVVGGFIPPPGFE
ncbi:MAG: amidase [Deltaproteobacteria bacterium]|nr:amidase [Deltaproteobacteria bacterium]